MSEIDKGAKYKVDIRNRESGVEIAVDIYDVLEAWDITCPSMAHAIKKLLMAGKRGSKDFNTDCNEAMNSVSESMKLQQWRN